MPVKPTLDQLRTIAHNYHMHMSDADLEAFRALMGPALASYHRLDQLTEPALPVGYPRSSGYRPNAGENLLGAWYWKCSIKGADEGLLLGKRLAIKDNVCVAGVPMMNGSSVLEGYVPEFDATIVTRILDAGGEIIGKTVCESLCFSGGSHTSDTGPVRNPHHPERSAGGSSSGSAALVVAGECDMAIGGDQAGSIRVPSGWCGAYGLKPTYGLVPYTGIFPVELTLDHVGPIAATTADVALLLEVIAGEDGLDPRQRDIKVASYTSALTGDVKGLRIGILREGFAWPDCSEPEVDELVEEAAHRFIQLGAQVSEVSLPLHRDGVHIWSAISVEGPTMLMMHGNGMGTNWKGHYSTSLLDAFAHGRLTRADDLSPTVKLFTLLGQYMQENYHGRYYARAQNLGRVLTRTYDEALGFVDLLVMPTLPTKAPEMPQPDTSLAVSVAQSTNMFVNTAPFNVTGHPAMTVPCGLSDGLPVAMMLVGRKWEETTVLRAAHAFEQISGCPAVRPQHPSASATTV